MSLSIKEIKEIFLNTEITRLPEVINAFADDERSGVRRLTEGAEKRYAAYLKEIRRMEEISVFERELEKNGYNIIGGTDEVGRGPLAGPVVAAVVILPKGCLIPGINDSKKLSAARREELSAKIRQQAVDFALGTASPKEIDEINILQATYLAMRRALNALSVKPDFLLADAVTIPEITVPQKGIIHGDARSITIGAASIVAKVERDAMMDGYDEAFEGYGFKHNKGYGSAEHIAAIKRLGPCPIHRRSFIKNFVE